MPKISRLSPNDESSVCSHSLCRKLDESMSIKQTKQKQSNRLMWGHEPSHLQHFLSNRHQTFRDILKPMSPVSFKRDNDSNLQSVYNKSQASRSSPYLKHMKSLRDKELFLLKSGIISDSSSLADINLKKEITLQHQLQLIVSPINLNNAAKNKKTARNRLKPSSTSTSSFWSDDSSIQSTSLHADQRSTNEWFKANSDRADSGGTACSGGSEYGIFEGELVSLNGDDELISNDSDSVGCL